MYACLNYLEISRFPNLPSINPRFIIICLRSRYSKKAYCKRIKSRFILYGTLPVTSVQKRYS